MDYGKFKYQEHKKLSEIKKNQKVIETKEIKVRPNIDDHDYQIKMNAMKRFFEDGDKVRVSLQFKGREITHKDLGFRLFQRIKTETAEIAKVELEPSMEGRQMIMVLIPIKG